MSDKKISENHILPKVGSKALLPFLRQYIDFYSFVGVSYYFAKQIDGMRDIAQKALGEKDDKKEAESKNNIAVNKWN